MWRYPKLMRVVLPHCHLKRKFSLMLFGALWWVSSFTVRVVQVCKVIWQKANNTSLELPSWKCIVLMPTFVDSSLLARKEVAFLDTTTSQAKSLKFPFWRRSKQDTAAIFKFCCDFIFFQPGSLTKIILTMKSFVFSKSTFLCFSQRKNTPGKNPALGLV